MNSAVDIFEALFEPDWKKGLIEAFPAIMDDDINRVRSVFTKKISRLRSILSPAVVAPAPAVDAPAPRVIPRDAQPPADSAKSKPPKKKVRVNPAPSDVTPPATAPLMEVDEPATPSSTPGKAPTKPLPVPSSKRAPPPKDAAPVSFRAPSAPRKRRQGKHTSHGASRRAIILTPPADSPVTAASFTPEVINNLNRLLKSDVKSDVILTHATVEGNGICIAASRVPSPSEIAFVLKHVRRIFPSPNVPIGHSPITSTSYLKIVDIPHVPASSKEWALKQHEAFISALNKSPVGASLAKLIKHKPRFMRASPHSDSCWAWGAMTRSPYFSSPVLNYTTRKYPADEVEAKREKEKDKRDYEIKETKSSSTPFQHRLRHRLSPSLNRAEDIAPSFIHLPHVPMSYELDRLVQEDRSSQRRKPLLLPPFVLFISGQLHLFPIRRPALICMSRKFRWFETKRLGIVLEEEDKSSYRSDSIQVVMVDPSHC
ncbi:hypothetical protein Agabi119p4_8338 [Agaricus bisporus var. burnettii]|uniref:Uncharacterized protein n=1 Tax=Agaricus bisporus var. burnettii TaxID=192524 RepID=A0A8H7EYN0_AGABI|nr:hypothetical protein Agabi119p4_8338 [Agaricus bisporus var. burnettii]